MIPQQTYGTAIKEFDIQSDIDYFSFRYILMQTGGKYQEQVGILIAVLSEGD